MERNRALVVSGIAGVLVLVMTGMGAALVQMGSASSSAGDGAGDLAAGLWVPTTTGSTAPVEPEPVIEYQDLYEIVPGPPATVDGAGPPVTAGADPGVGLAAAVPAAPAAPPAGPSSTAVAPSTSSPPGSGPVPAPAPTPATTARPGWTATTRPPGVPADWPPDEPVPPMPPDCRKAQLEDDGVWNCDH